MLAAASAEAADAAVVVVLAAVLLSTSPLLSANLVGGDLRLDDMALWNTNTYNIYMGYSLCIYLGVWGKIAFGWN